MLESHGLSTVLFNAVHMHSVSLHCSVTRAFLHLDNSEVINAN